MSLIFANVFPPSYWVIGKQGIPKLDAHFIISGKGRSLGYLSIPGYGK
jgi:hypothetical protein